MYVARWPRKLKLHSRTLADRAHYEAHNEIRHRHMSRHVTQMKIVSLSVVNSPVKLNFDTEQVAT